MYQFSFIKKVLSIALISLTCSASDSNLIINPTNQQHPTTSAPMKDLSLNLFSSLNTSQLKKSSFEMNSKEMSEWRYFPSPSLTTKLIFPDHHGLAISELDPQQNEALHKILETGLSSAGLDALNATLTLEKDNSLKFRGFVDWLLFNYNPNNYFISFFGRPSDANWAFRFEGHHISFTFNISNTDGKITISPAFIGTTLNKVMIDSKDGKTEVTPLKPVIQKIKALASTLTADQAQLATQSLAGVPKFNLFAPGLFGGPLKLGEVLPAGLKLASMTEAQKQDVMGILIGFQSNFNDQAAVNNLAALKNDSTEDIELIWAGDLKMENPFYVRIQGKSFAFELTCSEKSSVHYHAAWINR